MKKLLTIISLILISGILNASQDSAPRATISAEEFILASEGGFRQSQQYMPAVTSSTYNCAYLPIMIIPVMATVPIAIVDVPPVYTEKVNGEDSWDIKEANPKQCRFCNLILSTSRYARIHEQNYCKSRTHGLNE